MFSSTLIIGVAFIPLFTMTGVAGVIFSPMAHTYAFAIGGAILLALTLTPVLAERAQDPAALRPPGENGRTPPDDHEHEQTTGSCARSSVLRPAVRLRRCGTNARRWRSAPSS